MMMPLLILVVISAVAGAYTPCGNILDIDNDSYFQVMNTGFGGALDVISISFWFYMPLSTHCGQALNNLREIAFEIETNCSTFRQQPLGTPTSGKKRGAAVLSQAYVAAGCQAGGAASDSNSGLPVTPDLYDKWHHWVGVYNNQTLYNYIDGVFVPELNAALDPFTVNAEILFIGGGRGLSPTDAFTGSLHQVALYNKALDYCEVQQAFNGNPADVGGLLGLWDGLVENDKLIDAVGNNDGTIYTGDGLKRGLQDVQNASTRFVVCDNTPAPDDPLCPVALPKKRNLKRSTQQICTPPLVDADVDGCCSGAALLVPAISFLLISLLGLFENNP